MLQSNRDAFESLKTIEPHAVTDVTGFGLIGHLLEMLAGGDLKVTLNANAVPALTGAMRLLEQGWQSSLAPQLEPYRLDCEVDDLVEENSIQLMLDPQTSGGLLIAVSGQAWADLKKTVPECVRIGHFSRRSVSAASIRILP